MLDVSRGTRTRQSGGVLVIVAPGQGAQTPGFLAPWLEDPTFASRFGWLSTVAGMDALCATQGDRLVVVLGGVSDPAGAADRLVHLVDDGPVVVGPVAPDLAGAFVAARSALSAHRSATGGPDAPRPVRSVELLPERALAGDGHARRHLVEEIYTPLVEARGLVETLTAYVDHGRSTEAAARALFVHPNTVRYRLKQVAGLTGLSPSHPRDAFTLQIALVLGRQARR